MRYTPVRCPPWITAGLDNSWYAGTVSISASHIQPQAGTQFLRMYEHCSCKTPFVDSSTKDYTIVCASSCCRYTRHATIRNLAAFLHDGLCCGEAEKNSPDPGCFLTSSGPDFSRLHACRLVSSRNTLHLLPRERRRGHEMTLSRPCLTTGVKMARWGIHTICFDFTIQK